MQKIAYGPDPNQFGHLRLPEGAGPHPLVIVIHGGFWRARYDLSHMEPLAARLTEEGLATWSLEYRRTGQPGGGWPGTLDDVVAGAAYRAQLPVDAARAVAIGYSAGGHLALALAARDTKLRGAISLAGAVDLALAWEMRLSEGVVGDFLGGLPEDFPEACPENLPISVPQRLIHGDRDESVPIAISRSYLKRKSQEDVRLIELEGLGHSDLVDPSSAAWPVVREVILELL
jgi:acetyl esterase/lipase